MTLALLLLSGGFAGLVAAACMTVFELPFWRRWGMEGVAEWQVNAVIVSLLIRGSTRKRVSASMVVAMHLFHGAVLGIVFRLLLLGLVGSSFLSSLVPAYTIAYSAVLWIISPFLTRGLFERSGGFLMTRKGLTVSFLSHIVYGILLGLLVPVIG
jgi:hypothetical protein